MEPTPSNVTLALAVVAFIVWLVRLESKANTIAAKVLDHDGDLYKHIDNWAIHHEKDDLNRQFDELKNDLKADLAKIDSTMEKMSDRIDRLIEK